METRLDDRTELTVPADLESATAKLVYLYLAERGEASADEVATALGESKGTVLAIAGTLRKRDHVRRVEGRYVVDRP